MITFSSIQKLFSSEEWDVGLLTKEQLKIVSYYPIKWKTQLDKDIHMDFTNDIHFRGIVNTIVLVRNTSKAFDYSLYDEASQLLVDSGLNEWGPLYTNFKEAQILAGLGVRAKNSLVYNYKFGFDSKICAVGFKEEITSFFGVLKTQTEKWIEILKERGEDPMETLARHMEAVGLNANSLRKIINDTKIEDLTKQAKELGSDKAMGIFNKLIVTTPKLKKEFDNLFGKSASDLDKMVFLHNHLIEQQKEQLILQSQASQILHLQGVDIEAMTKAAEKSGMGLWEFLHAPISKLKG